MKAKNILAALLLMIGSNMMAEETKALTISYSGTEQSIPLPIVKRITFEDGYVVVSTAEGKHSYPISVLEKMTFTTVDDPTAIEALPEQAENVVYKNGTLSVKGSGLLRVYTTSGALVSIAQVAEGANISLNDLPAGVYVVRMGDKTIKVKK